ncbi:hypothetical protein CSAL01_12338 [Colletotrichum salicis]|uniref:Uncharacterized protein n=1 Tax=Colletotrichum salicis TaxID=1209931 RepID=A0A135S843_9PEZI|nr:hypothetical protein CSAL01_12338 [Colletotrichum salicis]
MTVNDWHETLLASPPLEGHLWQATAGQAGQSSNQSKAEVRHRLAEPSSSSYTTGGALQSGAGWWCAASHPNPTTPQLPKRRLADRVWPVLQPRPIRTVRLHLDLHTSPTTARPMSPLHVPPSSSQLDL